MTNTHSKPASDGQVCMIYRRNPRVVAFACLACGLSQIACQANREYEHQPCCSACTH